MASFLRSVIPQVRDRFKCWSPPPFSSARVFPPSPCLWTLLSEPLMSLHHFAVTFCQVRTNSSHWNWSTDPCWFWEERMDSSATTGTPKHLMPADQSMIFSAYNSVMGPTILKVGLYGLKQGFYPWFFLLPNLKQISDSVIKAIYIYIDNPSMVYFTIHSS